MLTLAARDDEHCWLIAVAVRMDRLVRTFYMMTAHALACRGLLPWWTQSSPHGMQQCGKECNHCRPSPTASGRPHAIEALCHAVQESCS